MTGRSRLAAGLMLVVTPAVFGGAFIFSGGNNSPDVVTHPGGYTGTGGNVTINICIDQTSPNAASMVVPVQNIVRTFNGMQAVNPNLKLGSNNNIPSGAMDFESVALHEVGHCIGLAHPNLATESGLSGADQNYTKADEGPDLGTDFSLDDGADNIIGSADDLRGDDVNLHWFRRADNNPFLSLAQPSASTMSRLLGDLPPGSSFAANADRDVGAALGFANSEAVMQQGSFFDEDQRALVADDVDTLRLARTGLDRTANTADDYTVTLTYGGLQPAGTPGCNVTLDFDDTQTGFAVCATGGQFLGGGNDVRITSANAFFNNSAVNWFFNQEANGGGLVEPFSFVDQIGVPPSTVRTSNTVTIQGATEPVAIEVTGGAYSIGCTGSFTASAGTIDNGQTVCVRHTSAASGAGVVNTTLSVGGVVDTFTSSTALQPGEPVNNLSGATGSQQVFGFSVPAGATNLVVSISGGTGDADLYVRFGSVPVRVQAPVMTDTECVPYLVGNNESCSFPAPDAGDWFVMIDGFSAYSGLTLQVEFDAPAVADADADGIRDDLDAQPNTPSNACTGSDATFANTAVPNGVVVQCAAANSVTVASTVVVEAGGRIDLISPRVRFGNGFSLPTGGRMGVYPEGAP